MNDRQKEYARAILQSSNRLVRLVNDILDLASIEAGYLELDRAEIDPSRLADAVEHLGRERARARRIDFSVRADADIARVLERLLLKGAIVVKKAYCDWARD